MTKPGPELSTAANAPESIATMVSGGSTTELLKTCEALDAALEERMDSNHPINRAGVTETDPHLRSLAEQLCLQAFRLELRADMTPLMELQAKRRGFEYHRSFYASRNCLRALALEARARDTPRDLALAQAVGKRPLDRIAVSVLKLLAESDLLLAVSDVAENNGGSYSRAAVAKALKNLEKMGYAERPQGPRKGYGITSSGRDIVDKLSTN